MASDSTVSTPASSTSAHYAKQALLANAEALHRDRNRWRWVSTISPLIWCAFAVMIAFVLCGILANVIAPHDPLRNDLRTRLVAPAFSEGGSTTYLLGTDQLGRESQQELYTASLG